MRSIAKIAAALTIIAFSGLPALASARGSEKQQQNAKTKPANKPNAPKRQQKKPATKVSQAAPRKLQNTKASKPPAGQLQPKQAKQGSQARQPAKVKKQARQTKRNAQTSGAHRGKNLGAQKTTDQDRSRHLHGVTARETAT